MLAPKRVLGALPVGAMVGGGVCGGVDSTWSSTSTGGAGSLDSGATPSSSSMSVAAGLAVLDRDDGSLAGWLATGAGRLAAGGGVATRGAIVSGFGAGAGASALAATGGAAAVLVGVGR